MIKDKDTEKATHLRLFFALPISPAHSPLLDIHKKLLPFSNLITIIKPENYHITIKFLGKTQKDTANDLVHACNSFNPQVAPISFKAEGLGAFPDTQNPSVIWCGLRLKTQSIIQLRRTVEDFTGNFGFAKDERLFRPHLTLARIKKGRTAPPEIRSLVRDMMSTFLFKGMFTRLVLYKSLLSSNGAQYTELSSINLL